MLQTMAWGAGTVVVPLALLMAWLNYTNPIKEAHASAWIFTSDNLSRGNWGLFTPQVLFSGSLWSYLLHCWDQAILWRWLLGAVLVLGLLLKNSRRIVLGVGGMFFVAQFMMPYAFAYQDYYYYSCALFVVVALGQVIAALLEMKHWWCGWLLLGLILTAQVHAYRSDYYQQQSVAHQGGYPFTSVVRDLTPKNSVIIVVGADWGTMTPLYSERRALMLRSGLEYDHTYLKQAYSDLADEQVAALIVWGDRRNDRNLIHKLTESFEFDPEIPTFTWEGHADIYIAEPYRKVVQLRLLSGNTYPGLSLPAGVIEQWKSREIVDLNPVEARAAFVNVSPLPYRFTLNHGLDVMNAGSRMVLSVHPDFDLWVKPSAVSSQIEWTYGMFDDAYEKEGDKSDGVIFSVRGETDDGNSRVIYERFLDPLKNEADRGDQHEMIPYSSLPGESLRFSARGGKSRSYDWAYSVEIKVH